MELVVGGGASTLPVVEALLRSGRSARLVDDFTRTRWADMERLIEAMGAGVRDVQRDVWNLVWGEVRLEVYPVPPDDPHHLDRLLRDVQGVVWTRGMNGHRAAFLAQAEAFWREALPRVSRAFWVDPPPLAQIIFGDLPIRWVRLSAFLRDLSRSAREPA